MKEIAAALLIWINANSGFDYVGDPPKIMQTDPENLAHLILGEVPRIPEKAKTHLMGLYDVETETIWLRNDFDPTDHKHRGHLVHELVHYLQYQGDRARDIANDPNLEPEAYALQNRYLRAHDSAPIPIKRGPNFTN